MNVYFILFGLLSGAVPTEVVPARDNLLAGRIKPRQSAPVIPYTATDDYHMKEAGIGAWTNKHTSETNTLTRHRRKRADPLQTPTNTAGLEKDTDDPDGVYRTLDELKSMKPGPGVQWRDEMPVMSKENPGDLRRKKRSREVATKQTMPNRSRAYEGNLRYGRELFSQEDVSRKNGVQPSTKSMRLHFSASTLSDDAGKSFRTHHTRFDGGVKHSADRRVVHKATLLHRLENDVHKLNLAGITAAAGVSAETQAWPGINVKKKDQLKDMWSYRTVNGERKSHHRRVRDSESSGRTFDMTDVPLSGDSDQWWNKKLNYIDNRNRATYRIKLQQSNTSADNSENVPEQRRTAISLRGVISDDRSPQTTSKQSGTSTEKKSDDWLKNELMLIEIESRALKRKAAQLHNKMRKVNIDWKEVGSDSAPMYATDGPRHDIVESYSRLNKRIDRDGFYDRLGGIRNIEATEHRIERKHRLPEYGQRLRPDITDAVMKLDNDLADLKARMSQNEKDMARPRVYYVNPNMYHDIYYDPGEYYPRRIFRRYRRNVNKGPLKQRDPLHAFLNNTTDPSSRHQLKAHRVQTHDCKHGGPCSKLAHTGNLTYILVREPRHKDGIRDIYRSAVNGVSVAHVESAPHNRVPTLKQKPTFHPQWNTSLNHAKMMESNKGKHPTTIKGRIARIIVSLTKILLDIPTLPRAYWHKYPLLNTHGISWPADYKALGIPGNSENLSATTNMSHRKPPSAPVSLVALLTLADDNEVLTVLKTTSHGHSTLLRVWIGNRQFAISRLGRHMLPQTRGDHRNKSPYATAKRRKSVDRQNISFLSSESKNVSRQIWLDLHRPQKQPNLIILATIDQKNTVDVYLYLKTSFRALRKKQMKWPRSQASPRGIRLNHTRLTVYPSILILYDHSARRLHSKFTGQANFAQHPRPHTGTLWFRPWSTRDIPNQYIQRQPGQRHASDNRNRLTSRSTLVNRMKKYDKAKTREFFQRTLYVSGLWGNPYVNLRLRLDSRLFAPYFRNSGLMLKGVGRDRFASPLHVTDTGRNGRVVFKNRIRHKRSRDGITADELSMKEDLDGLFKQFPVSESEKSMNSKLQQAEEAELVSTDVGRFIMERNKNTESTEDVLSSDTRFRRQVRASQGPADQERRLDKLKHSILGAILRYTTKYANGPQSTHEGTEKEHVPRSLLSVLLFGNKSYAFIRNRLDKQKYSNILQTIDNSGESNKQTTYKSKVPHNSAPYTVSKLVSLLDGIPSRFPRDTHDLNMENCSTPYVTASARATSGFPGAGSGHTDFPGAGSGHTDFPGASSSHTDFPGAGSGHTDFPGAGSGHTDFPGASSGHTDFPDAGHTDFPGASSGHTDFPDAGHTDFPGAGSGHTDFPGAGSGHTDFPDAGHTDFPGAGSGHTDFLGAGSGHTDFQHAGSGHTDFPGAGRDTTDMEQYASPLAINSSDRKDSKTNETHLNTAMFPGTDLNGEHHNVDNITNGTSLPNLHNISSHTGVAQTNQSTQSRFPSPLMLDSGTNKFTNMNSALKAFMANSANRNMTQFNKAINSFMTNSSYRNSSVVGDQLVNTSSNAGPGQASLVDYFDNNANLEEASAAAGDQDASVKSTDTQTAEDKEKAAKAETSEGIQVDVEGHKVEPEEPFAFIEKDEVTAPAENQFTWSEWSECSATCGIGQKFRSNRCGGDQPCTGNQASAETEVCSITEVC